MSSAELDETKDTETTETESNPAFQLYDDRILEVDGTQQSFKVLVISRPDRWQPAKEIKTEYDLALPGGKVIKFPLTCLSWGEWEDIESKYNMPEYDSDFDPGSNIITIDKQRARQKERDEIIRKRQVEAFQVSTGKPIPGESIEEKAQWLGNLGAGNSDALFSYILEKCSGLSDAEPEMLAAYKRGVRSSDTATTFSSFSDLVSEANVNIFFRMQRPVQDFIMEFPVKHVSDAKKKEIEDQTPDPVAPSKPGKNPMTGKPDASYPIYNYRDSRYIQALRTSMRVRTSLWLEALLSFEIPGSTQNEKYEWIRARPMGDVYKLKNFINEEILSYHGRLNFF